MIDGLRPLLVGTLLGMVLGGAGIWWLMTAEGPALIVDSRGDDLSRHGVARLLVYDDTEFLVQTCKGICDDVRVSIFSGEGGIEVVATRADGAVVVRNGLYVTSGTPQRVMVGGAERLKVTRGEDTLHY